MIKQKIMMLIMGWIAMVFLFFSCGSDGLEGKAYMDFIRQQENGLVVEQKSGIYHAILEYKPIDLMMLYDVRKYDVSQKEYRELTEEYEGAQYFNLKLGVDSDKNPIALERVGVKSYKELEQRITDLSYNMKNDIFLIEGRDTIAPSLFHFERTYGLTPFKTFVLAFPESNRNMEDKTILINSDFLKIENFSMTIKASDINNVPNLVIN